ncbi:MAG TPA: aldehyde dehydrogenase family protein, partial [Gemmatimonadales bacterium]|nr:aldehyde dehydrogenase family protein [Gemmatimonadales bacterium]
DATLERRNPSDNRDLVARVPVGERKDIDAAVEAAAAAFTAWRRATGPSRADLLYRWGEAINARSGELADAIVREVGKPVVEARGEVARAVVICRYYAGEAVRELGEVIPAQSADTLQFTQHDPLGVVALITPWNFPVAIPVWKAAPALACGNTVVLKPSEHSGAVASLLAETAGAAGLPAGSFNVVHGDGSTGAALISHPDIRGISFTGSAAVGHRIQLAAAERNIPCQAEMGGKNAVIVGAGADLDRAARLTAGGAFRYAGQKCTATSRVIVESSVIADFLPRLDAEMHKLVVGPVTDSAAMVGPLVTSAAVDRVNAALASAGIAPEATMKLPDGDQWRHGNWLVPQRFRVESGDHPLAREELFAPVLVTLEARDLAHAIELANHTPYGLSASLFTGDVAAALEYIRDIEAGLVRVNGDTTGVDPHAPFGGVKGSSSGSREQGRAARDFYTEIRTIQIHS